MEKGEGEAEQRVSPHPASSYRGGTTVWICAGKWNNLGKNDRACESDTCREIHRRERKGEKNKPTKKHQKNQPTHMTPVTFPMHSCLFSQILLVRETNFIVQTKPK